MQMTNIERYSLKLTSSTFRRVAAAQNQFVDQIFNKYTFHRKNYLGFLSLVYRPDVHPREHEHISIQKMILQLELELKSSGMERTQTTVWRQFALLQLNKLNVLQSSLSKYTQEWTKVELTTDTHGHYQSIYPALHNSSKIMIHPLSENAIRDVPLLRTDRVQRIIQVREALNGSAGSSIRPAIQSGEKSFPHFYRKGSSPLQHTALIFQENPYDLETSMDVREPALKKNNGEQLGLTSTQHGAGTQHWTEVRFSSVQRRHGFSNREWQRPFLETTQIRTQGQSLGLFTRVVQSISKFQLKTPFLGLQGSKQFGAKTGSPTLLDREPLFGIHRTSLQGESTKLNYMFSGPTESQLIRRLDPTRWLGPTRRSFQYPLLSIGLSQGFQFRDRIFWNTYATIDKSKLPYLPTPFQLLQVNEQKHKDHRIDRKTYDAQDQIGRNLQYSRKLGKGIVFREHARLKHSIVRRDYTMFKQGIALGDHTAFKQGMVFKDHDLFKRGVRPQGHTPFGQGIDFQDHARLRHSIAFLDSTRLKYGIVLRERMKYDRIAFQISTMLENSIRPQSSIDEKNRAGFQNLITLENHLVLQEGTRLQSRIEQQDRREPQNWIVLQYDAAFPKNTNTASFQDSVSHKHTLELSRIAFFQEQLGLEQVQRRRNKQIIINTAQSLSRKAWLKWVSQSSRSGESYQRAAYWTSQHIELFRQPEISSFGIDLDQMKQRIQTGFASRTSFQHIHSLFLNTILATRSGTYRTKGKSNVREDDISKLPQHATLLSILEMGRLDPGIYRHIFNHESKVTEMSKVNKPGYRQSGQVLYLSDSFSHGQNRLYPVQGLSLARKQGQLLRYDQQLQQQQRSRRARESAAVSSLPIQLGIIKRQSVALWQRRLFQRLVEIADVAKTQRGPVLLHQFTGPSSLSWSAGFKLNTDSGAQKLAQKTIEMNPKSDATSPYQKEGKFQISSLFTDIHRNTAFKRKLDNQDKENRQGKVRNNRLMNDSITIIRGDYRAVQKHGQSHIPKHISKHISKYLSKHLSKHTQKHMQEHVQWHESLNNIDRRDINRINRISVQRENIHRNERSFLADNVSIEYAEEQNRHSINKLQGAVEQLQSKINHTLSSFETNTGHSGNKIKLANIEIGSSDFDLDDLVDKVYRELEKKFEFEQQRRGLN